MDCQKITEKMELLLDNELQNEERETVMSHIDQCPECRQKFNIESTLREAIKSKLERKVVPDHMVDSIRSNIQKIA